MFAFVCVLCKINSAIVFVCVRSIIFYCHFIASRYKCRSPKKGFQLKTQEWSVAIFVLAWCQFLRLADVKDIFDALRKPEQYCSECLVTKVKKQQKTCWKHLNWLQEIRLQILKNWRFFPCCYKIVLEYRYLMGISWITCMCKAVWCLPICWRTHFWKKILLGFTA